MITFPDRYKENVRVDFNIYTAEMENVWKITEPGLQLALESTSVPENVLTKEDTDALVNALYACPHGVFSMSYRMPGLVETSTNLAAVRFNEPNNILITTSQRSDVNSEKFNIANIGRIGIQIGRCQGRTRRRVSGMGSESGFSSSKSCC